MKRRDFLKRSSLVLAVPAIPAIVVAKTGVLQANEPVTRVEPDATPPGEVVPAPQLEPQVWPSAHWRSALAVWYKSGALYFNKLTGGWMVYRRTCAAPDGFWDIQHVVGSDEVVKGLPCPRCMKREWDKPENQQYKHQIGRALSVVCNTWPFGGVPTMCMCGHPWLYHAHEDYILWLRGETDAERSHRRSYMTSGQWFRLRATAMTDFHHA